MFDKIKAKQFRADFQLAVAQLEKDHGVNISLGTITFGSNELRGKMTARKGTPQTRSVKGDFRAGDVVTVNYRKINPNDTFVIEKINNKNIVIKGDRGHFSVNPSLLTKQH